jgi:hypothetical protein
MRRAISKIGEKSEEVEGEDAIFVPSPLERLCHNMKMRLFGKWERWSGGKDLERQPLTVWIQDSQP